MSEAKKHLYALLIFLVFLAPFLLLAEKGMDAVTGLVTAEKQKAGTLRILPHFTVGLNDWSYSGLRIRAKELLAKCSSEKDLSACLPQGWPTQCGNDKEKAFAKFALHMNQCSRSQDNYCLCTIPLSAEEIEIEWAEDYVFAFSGQRSQGPETDLDPADDGSVAKSGNSYRFRLTMGAQPFLEVYDDEKKQRKLRYQSARTFKSGNTLVFISEQEHEALAQSYRECRLPNERDARFCVDTRKALWARSPYDNSLGDNSLVYRFALRFQDNSVPLHAQFSAEPLSDRIRLTWDAADTDISHYSVYVSAEKFDSLDDAECAGHTEDTEFSLGEYRSQGLAKGISPDTGYYIAVVPVDYGNNYGKKAAPVLVRTAP